MRKMIHFLFFSFLFYGALAHFPKFDKNYEIYLKNQCFNFPYSKNEICNICLRGNHYFSHIENAYTLKAHAPLPLYHVNKYANIDACFKYNGHSYVIFNYGNSTSIMRSRIVKHTNKIPGKFMFDNVQQKLYNFNNGALSNVDLKALEKDWWWYNLNVNTKIIRKLNIPISDIMIANATIYYIFDNKIMKTGLNETTVTEIAKINKPSFDFIPFPENPLPNFVISPPSSSILSKLGDEKMETKMLILLYVLDVVFIVVILISYKYGKKLFELINKNALINKNGITLRTIKIYYIKDECQNLFGNIF